MVFRCSPDASSQMGGAMAPPMKDLPRWLEENPEFAVAPDWTDIVKQSVSTRKKSTYNCVPGHFLSHWLVAIQSQLNPSLKELS